MTTKKNKLYVLIGVPGCGKSFFATEMTKNLKNCVWVSRDAIRYNAFGGVQNVTYDNYFKHESKVKTEFWNIINAALAKGYDVIADATHINPASRKNLLSKIYEKHGDNVAVVFKTPLPLCKERNNTRTGVMKVPDSHVNRLWYSFQYPTFDEGFQQIVEVDSFGKVIKCEESEDN